MLGLLADLPRKNCWSIAEHAGDATPDGMQHLLARAVWDEDGVRDDLRAYVVEHLGDPAAVLVVDETGDLKKGTDTVGVGRQYNGTAGKVDNAQVAVYLAYATAVGHGVIDRELYLPQGWLGDPARCQAAGVPAQRAFATKPELARRMLERALDAGVPGGWVTADEAYGGDPRLRGWLEQRGLASVLAVKGYDYPRCRRALRRRGITPRIARRGIESSQRLGRHRYVVERSLAWLVGYRRLQVRYERRADILLGFLHLACALICLKALKRAKA